MTVERSFPRWLVAGTLLAAAAVGGVQAQGHGGPGGRFGPEGAGGPRGFGLPLMSERALDAVNASTEQRAQLRQIFDAARADLRSQHESGRALREQMRTLFTQPTVDARAAEVLRQQKMALHDQQSKRMLQAMLDASRVLSPEQRSKLAEAMAQRRERAGRGG